MILRGAWFHGTRGGPSGGRLVSRIAAGTRRQRWTGLAACAGVLAVTGVALLQRRTTAGLWLTFVAALVAHWAGRRASDCGVLAGLSGVPVLRIAAPLTMVPARSSSPLLDLARIRAAGAGAVSVDGTIRLLPVGRVERVDLNVLATGRWDLLAVAPHEVDGTVTADRLRRLPDEDEVWLVRTSTTARMLSGDRFRAAAAEARGAHGARPAEPAGGAQPDVPDGTIPGDRAVHSAGRRGTSWPSPSATVRGSTPNRVGCIRPLRRSSLAWPS